MRAVKSRDTGPEIEVRRLVHRMGFRFSLRRKDLPGKPDLALPRLKKVVFVHGCFWHGHRCARGNRVPRNNRQYWIEKIQANRIRDKRTKKRLKLLGWDSLAVWECWLKDEAALVRRLREFLDD